MAWAKIGIETANTLCSASSVGPSVRLRGGWKMLRFRIAGNVFCEMLAVTLPSLVGKPFKYKFHAALLPLGRLTVSPDWDGVHVEKAKISGSRGLSCVTGYRPSCRTFSRRAKRTVRPCSACQTLICQEHRCAEGLGRRVFTSSCFGGYFAGHRGVRGGLRNRVSCLDAPGLAHAGGKLIKSGTTSTHPFL